MSKKSSHIIVYALEILASKICHDLISPIGAIHNGLEIMEEMGGGAEQNKDVMDLITASAGQASARLQTFRVAYGLGGSEAHITQADVYKVIEAYISADGKIRQEWDPVQPLFEGDIPRGFAKILTCALLLMIESLPRGGTLSVGRDTKGVFIKASGEGAGLFEVQQKALKGDMNTSVPDPRAAHAQIARLIAEHYGFVLDYSVDSKMPLLRIRLIAD